MSRVVRVVIGDDHPVVRAGLLALLSTAPDVEVVGEAATPTEAVSAAASTKPDVVLMDLQFGAAETGADATRAIIASEPHPAVLILTNYDTDADILTAIEAGASGYLLKDAPADDLLAAIRAAAAGESALAPAIAGRLMNRLRSPAVSLSAREIDVLSAVAEGLSNAEVAARLFVSEATVKTHLAHVYTKLGVASRSAAVAAARTHGIFR
ncbi:DNA-binding NarL/FixJ family response regulator [Microbacterium halimionae]|uniref:DNA-binding NarL/FixJ family response regulator n=1 Tax=Microbacterium halimionae TaxID=1526413 RepID=A0A7W3PLA4_9MICO|nr:response regulator transcription factor [Microbacterium halimionae]MBA8815968.1 DNA-binding NarL/FixJ family response regulator [Microbacterium halimionae]NII96171.1 DNA-binding NarL/FixJ family response regulator [Microbacterium halimionae]